MVNSSLEKFIFLSKKHQVITGEGNSVTKLNHYI